MSDGRCFTSFISNCQLNENIKARNKLNTNNEYRKFLQENSEQLLNDFRDICGNESKNECISCWGQQLKQ